MTANGWTVDDALAQFAAAGKPLDPAGFRALVRHARRLGNLEKAGELRKPAGSEGGRGYIVFEIGQMQLMHKDSVRWLGLPSSGDT